MAVYHVLHWLMCLPVVLLLRIQVDAYTPQLDGQGFKLPLDLAIVSKQPTTSRAFEYLATLGVLDREEFAYLVQITIGDQSFMCMLDTASADLASLHAFQPLSEGSSLTDLQYTWVVSSDCTDPDCQTVKTYRNTSTLALSVTTFKAWFTRPFDVFIVDSQPQTFKLKFVQGTVSGTVGYETVTLGQVEVHEQVFGLVTKVSSINLSGMRNSGILGLAFPKSSSIQRSAGKTFLENIYDGMDENSRFFAFHLGRGAEPSSFTIGQVEQHFLLNTSLSYFPVYPASITKNTYNYWKIPLRRVTLNGTPLPFLLSRSRVPGSPSPISVLDTGTSLMLGPVRDVVAFWNAVGGAKHDGTTGLWMVRCSRAITVSLVFGGTDGVDTHEYFLDPRDLSWNGTRSGDWCLGGIQGNDKVISGDWLLGDTFLRNVYATHHAATSSTPPLIGLANLTDPVAALAAFQAERGKDQTGPVNFHVIKAGHSSSSTPFLLLSATAGFTSGLLAIVALKLGVCRCIGRKRHLF